MPEPDPRSLPERIVRAILRAWLAIRVSPWLQLRGYYHKRCEIHRFRWHKVSLPPEGPLLTLCPRGAYHIAPAYWHLPAAERITDLSGPAAYIDPHTRKAVFDG